MFRQMTKVLTPYLRCSPKALTEHLSLLLLLPRNMAKALKMLMCMGVIEHLRSAKLLKVLTPIQQLSTLAKNRTSTGFCLSYSLSTLGEHLRTLVAINYERNGHGQQCH